MYALLGEYLLVLDKTIFFLLFLLIPSQALFAGLADGLIHQSQMLEGENPATSPLQTPHLFTEDSLVNADAQPDSNPITQDLGLIPTPTHVSTPSTPIPSGVSIPLSQTQLLFFDDSPPPSGWLPQNAAAAAEASSDENYEGSQELPGSDNEEEGSSEASEPIPSYQVPREPAAGRVRGLTRRVSQALSSQGSLSQRRGANFDSPCSSASESHMRFSLMPSIGLSPSALSQRRPHTPSQ